MTLQAQPLRRIFARFFPRRYVAAQTDGKQQWDLIPVEQKKDLAIRYLSQGELSLLQDNLSALSLFEAASQLDSANFQIWYRQGLAFFEYGSKEGKEKALLLSGKSFKIALQLNPSFFKAYVAWGDTLLQLGRSFAETHFFIEAKEKYQKAIELSSEQDEEVLSELYWSYGMLWLEIAKHSGEAVDLSFAIDALKKACQLTQRCAPELLNDLGKAYLEMGLLVNDSRLHMQAIEIIQRAVKIESRYFDGWIHLAESYSQIYLNTMDERYVNHASDAYAHATKLSPRDAETWLSWAQILAESGRLRGDVKFLHLSIEKCVRANALDANDPFIIAQWVESLSYLGMLASRLDLLIEAEEKILKATDLFPDDPDLWHAYGICLIAFGCYYHDPEYYAMAIEKLQWGLSADRTSAEHWHALGIAHRHYGDLLNDESLIERANRFFSKAIDLKPACPALTFDTASSLLQLSRMTDDLASLQKAIDHLEHLLQGNKESIIYHPKWIFEYASALEWLGDFSDEESHFHHAIEIFCHVLLIQPDFPQIHAHLALCYIELGHLSGEVEYYKRAIHSFRFACSQDEENDRLWLDWGVCLIHLAHHTLDVDFMNQLYWSAEQKLHRAGQLGNPYAHYSLACLYSILGRTDEAMGFLRRALASRALPTIDELLDDEWLETLRSTGEFSQFLSDLEAKLQQTREE